MDIRNINKIIIVSLCDSYTKNLAKQLSQNLNMLFCETKELIEYELIDKNALMEHCSKEYLDNAERKVLEHIASFVNVVVSINYEYLTSHIDLFKNDSLIVFIKLSKKFVQENGKVVDVIAYENRTNMLEKCATLTVAIKKTETDFVTKKILSELGGLL